MADSNFQGKEPSWSEDAWRIGYEARDEGEPVGTAVERGGGIVLNFAGEVGNFAGRDVGQVGDEDVERPFNAGEEIGLSE